MTYKIKYNFKTGNSFGSHTEEDILELSFQNYDVALANLKRIEEHYNFTRFLDSYEYKRQKFNEKEESIKPYLNKDWIVLKEITVVYKDDKSKYIVDNIERYVKEGYIKDTVYDNYLMENSVILYTDNGNKFQFSPDWIGHFERLNWVEIICDVNPNRIEF